MISTVLVIAALASQQMAAAGPRQQFSSCLRAFLDSKLEERMTPEAFDTAVAEACSAQETAYRQAFIQAAVRAGDNRAAAERDADLEVGDLRTNYRELFRGAQPQ